MGIQVVIHCREDLHAELQGAYLSVLTLPTAKERSDGYESLYSPDQGEGRAEVGTHSQRCNNHCCGCFVRAACAAWGRAVPIFFKQLTPDRFEALVLKDFVQIVLAVLYSLVEGPTAFVMCVSISIP